MENKNEALQLCFANLAQEMGLEHNNELLARMADLVTPVPLAADPETPRSIDLELSSSGKVTGEFQHLKNLLDLDFKGILDLLKSSDNLSTGLAIGAAFTITPYLLLLGVLQLAYDGTIKKISSDNAEVLYAIYKLEKRRFTKAEVEQSYQTQFAKPLPDRYWARSLDRFLEFEIVSRSRGDQYKLEEEVRTKHKL
jgi:hypothetical protein